MQDMNQLIVLKQLPIIEEKLYIIKEQIQQRVSEALSLKVTEDNVKKAKKIRAEFNKEYQLFEDERKKIKKDVLEPYEQFQSVYEDCVSGQYKVADEKLKEQINNLESQVKAKKENDLKEYFDELCELNNVSATFITAWEIFNPNITLTVTLKNLKEQAKVFVEKAVDETTTIEAMENGVEILAEYNQDFNLTSAIKVVKARHERIELERQKQEELKAAKQAQSEAIELVEEIVQENLATPLLKRPLPPIDMPVVVVEEEPIKTLSFNVTAPLSKLKKLKEFLIEGGYEFE